MNQIYKVIWSRVRRCYVVVSEIAGSCGKNGGVASKKLTLDNDTFENTGKSRFFERRTSRVLY